jgi:hypothetical protein
VALLIAGLILLGDANTGDGGQSVLDFYRSNESEQTAGVALLAYGSLFLILFAGALRSGLRRGSRDAEGLATLAFGGGLVMAVGLMLHAGTAAALADNSDVLDPIAAQAINALGNGTWIPFIVGQSVLLLASGAAILRGGALPSWLGWAAIVLGVVSTAPAGELALPPTLLWIVVVAILLSRRASGSSAPAGR